MDKDLSNIRERYHEIWTTDWNKGDNCTLSYEDRYRISKLWTEYNRQDLHNPELNYIY